MKILPRHAACLASVIGVFLTLPINGSPQTSDRKQDQTAAAPSPQELFEKRLSPSVFVVEALNEKGSVVAIGSGVAVAPDEVVTNQHVIEDGEYWQVKRGSKTWPATLSHLDSDHDLGQLKVLGLKMLPVSVRDSSTLVIGERVYAIGAPEGLELTLSEGIISGLREDEQVRLIQTSAAISHGSSGGGLFDAQGRLIGITSFFLKEGQNLNFALPGELVRALATQQLTKKQKTEMSPDFRSQRLYEVGYEADEAGDHEKAIMAFREAARLDPHDPIPWHSLGIAYNSLQRYDEAIKAYQEALRQFDKTSKGDSTPRVIKRLVARVWFSLGVTYGHLKQTDQEVRAYREAVRLDPDHNNAWFSLGFAYSKQKDHEQAIRAYREAVRIKPDDVDAWNFLGGSYDDSHQWELAMGAYREALRLKPDYAETWFYLGNHYTQLDHFDQAAEALREAVRLKPDHIYAWDCLGTIYSAQHDRSKMMQVYEMLKTLDRERADEFFQKFVLP